MTVMTSGASGAVRYPVRLWDSICNLNALNAEIMRARCYVGRYAAECLWRKWHGSMALSRQRIAEYRQIALDAGRTADEWQAAVDSAIADWNNANGAKVAQIGANLIFWPGTKIEPLTFED